MLGRGAQEVDVTRTRPAGSATRDAGAASASGPGTYVELPFGWSEGQSEALLGCGASAAIRSDVEPAWSPDGTARWSK